MHRHRAVLLLAAGPAVLPLDPRGLLALLGIAGLVEDADGVGVAVARGHLLLNAIPHSLLVPVGPREKLLERARRRVEVQCDRLDALAGQIAQLALDVGTQMLAGLATPEAAVKPVQEPFQPGPQLGNGFGIHATSTSFDESSLVQSHLRLSHVPRLS